MRIVIGVIGAPLGIRLLRAFGERAIETHLTLGDWVRARIEMETTSGVNEIQVTSTFGFGGIGGDHYRASNRRA